MIMDNASTSNAILFAKQAWIDQQWVQNVRIQIDCGVISEVETLPNLPSGSKPIAALLPGMINLHSHAFQRQMAGLAEYSHRSGDDFWSWRNSLFRLVARISPEQIYSIACRVYRQMLLAGYTRVCEFHYLHHDQQGNLYQQPSLMAAKMIAAANTVGIALTLLPVLYCHGGFTEKASTAQRRFINDVDTYLRIVDDISSEVELYPHVSIGLAFHSLRAVRVEEMKRVLDARKAVSEPIHIHIAEQDSEVQQSLAHTCQRPVQWLYANLPVDQHWCLVHATHIQADEIKLIANSNAVVGLCPTTEANLGDGFFPFREFQKRSGFWGIGSDSQISINPVEELRWLEYGQRLQYRKRNLLGSGRDIATAHELFEQALKGGAAASGSSVGGIAKGRCADFISLDTTAPELAHVPNADLLSAWIFASNNPIDSVWVGGRKLIEAGAFLVS